MGGLAAGAGMFLPGGTIWIAIGALIGAGIENAIVSWDAWVNPPAPEGVFVPGIPIGGGALPAPPRDPGRIGRVGEFEEGF